MRYCKGRRRGNHLYSITTLREKEDSPNVVIGIMNVFDFTIYEFLDPGASLSFVTPYISMNFDIIPKELG